MNRNFIEKQFKTVQAGAPGRRGLEQSTNRGSGASVGMSFIKKKI